MILYGDLHGNCNGALDLIKQDALVKKYGEAVLKQKYLVILGGWRLSLEKQPLLCPWR